MQCSSHQTENVMKYMTASPLHVPSFTFTWLADRKAFQFEWLSCNIGIQFCCFICQVSQQIVSYSKRMVTSASTHNIVHFCTEHRCVSCFQSLLLVVPLFKSIKHACKVSCMMLSYMVLIPELVQALVPVQYQQTN